MTEPRVLIVDDDANSLRMSKTTMEALIAPEHILCASTAAETMAILQKEPVD